MNAFVRPAKHTFVAIDEIDLSHTIRPYNAIVVAELAQSIRAIGLQTPLTCIVRDGQHILVAGRNRLEALRLVGAEQAPVRIVDFSDVEAQLWRLSENLHRAELTKLQYDQQVVEYAEILKAKLAGEAAAQPLQAPKVDQRCAETGAQCGEPVADKVSSGSCGPRTKYPGADGSPRLSDRITSAGSAGSGGRDGPRRQSVRTP